MIAIVLLAAAAPAVSADAARFEACAALAESAPDRAVAEANDWRLAGGGVLARQCAGLAYVRQVRWTSAVSAFELAAREAEVKRDGRAAVLWVQAGNAALAGNDPAKAAQFLDAAIARGQLQGDALGEAYLDRGRARAALGQLPAARTDLDQAVRLVPADPLGWLLSATLARKTGDLARARSDIGEAATRSPDDASVALEAGNIAILSGRTDAARTAWEAAIRIAPDGPSGRSAAEALGRLGKGE